MKRTPGNRHLAWTIVIPLLGLWAITAFLSYRVWVHGADHRDFYPRWAGVRRLLSGSRDLYSQEAVRAIQVSLYGAPLPADRDQQAFAYPAQLAVLLIPFGLIPNVEIATAIWQGLSLILVLFALLLLRPHAPGPIPLYVILAFVFWHYTLLMLFQGQITAIPFAAVVAGAVAFLQHRDFLAGVALSLGVVKPELAFLPIGALTVLSLREKRPCLLVGFLVGSLVLFGASLLIAGWWVPTWITSLGQYAVYAKVVWPLGESWRLSPLLAVAFIIGVAAMLLTTPRSTWTLIGASVPAGMLLLPQTLTWGLTMLAVPLLLSWRHHGRIAVIAVWILGWLALFIRPLPDWWKIQAVAMPALSVATLILAHHPFRDDGDAASAQRLGGCGKSRTGGDLSRSDCADSG